MVTGDPGSVAHSSRMSLSRTTGRPARIVWTDLTVWG